MNQTIVKKSVVGLALGVGLATAGVAVKHQIEGENEVPAVTFANSKGNIYLPARIVATKLDLYIEKKSATTVAIGDKEVNATRSLYDGRKLVSLQDIRDLGGLVDKDSEPGKIKIVFGEKTFDAVVGTKQIDVDQSKQRLVGTQGSLVVIDTNVSTGSRGHRTPNGTFKTGPYKSRYHYSRLYNNAPMPYSVQVVGNVFFHGYGYVPSYPASHGCIRVPLGKRNPAKYLFNWVDTGVTTTVHGRYTSKSRKRRR